MITYGMFFTDFIELYGLEDYNTSVKAFKLEKIYGTVEKEKKLIF